MLHETSDVKSGHPCHHRIGPVRLGNWRGRRSVTASLGADAEYRMPNDGAAIMTETDTPSAETKPTSIWDNDLPTGDSPPMPRWPLIAATVAFAIWAVFLIGMMVMRLTYQQ